MPQNPFRVFQSGDGQRYAVNIPMVQQVAASTARALVNDRHSKIATEHTSTNSQLLLQATSGMRIVTPGLDGAIKGILKEKVDFKSVAFDKAAAVKDFDAEFRHRYANFWTDFQSSGSAAKQGLLKMRKHAELRIKTLSQKFQECGITNQQSLAMLEENVWRTRVIRDAGFTIVAAWATGGIAAGAGTVGSTGGAVASISGGAAVRVAAGTALVKATAKAADVHAEGKLQSVDGGLVFADLACDLMFIAVGGSGAFDGLKNAATGAKEALGHQILFLACTKAPLEMAKSAASGNNIEQILFSGAFELAGVPLDALKDGIAKKLFPSVCKLGVNGIVDGFLNALKDVTMAKFASPPQALPPVFDSISSFFGDFFLSDEQFIDRYVLVKR